MGRYCDEHDKHGTDPKWYEQKEQEEKTADDGFWQAWARMEELGKCDGALASEYWRIRDEWEAAGKVGNLDEFIEARASLARLHFAAQKHLADEVRTLALRLESETGYDPDYMRAALNVKYVMLAFRRCLDLEEIERCVEAKGNEPRMAILEELAKLPVENLRRLCS